MQLTNQPVALYARLSKDRSGLSENVQIQLREGTYFVEDNGGQVVASFTDNDISASKFSTKPRPEYDLLVAAIERGEVEVIVVTEMTRLYRRIEELLELIKMAEHTKLRGIFTTDGIGYDLSTPEGIHAAIGAVNNAMLESARLSKRQKRKKKVRAEQGRYLGGYRAYGYEGALKDEAGTVLNRGRINVALVDREVEIYRDCVRRIIAGERAMTIMRDLNQRGIPSPDGKQWAAGNFKRLFMKKRYVVFETGDHPTDCVCLTNPSTGGTLVHGEAEHRAVWPGLIAREEYELMMSRFRETAQNWNHGLVHGRTYMLSGLVFCACGSVMYGSARQRPDGTYQRRYRCKGVDNHGNRVGCGKVFRSAEPLELFVTEAVLFRFDSPEAALALSPKDDGTKVEDLVATLAKHQLHRKNLVKEYGRGEHKRDDYKVMLEAADDAIEQVQEELAKFQNSRAASLLPANKAVREVWPDASLDWRHSVIGLLVDRVVIHPGHPGSHLWNGYRFNPEMVAVDWKA